MPETGDRFEHEALRSPTTIRLLRIFADHYNAPIRAQIDQRSLESKPDYLALSYVWGDAELQHELWIGGRILKIRQNLFDAIQRIRTRGTTTIWIDAVCINQSDLQERADQVMLMRQIYESATCVLVYLGEANESLQLRTIFNSMVTYVCHQLGTGTAMHRLFGPTTDWANLQKYGLPDVTDAHWQSLVRLLEHPWFSRVWIFQEVLVARNCLFICGEWTIDRPKFFFVFNTMMENGLERYIDRAIRGGLSPVRASIQRCMSIFHLQRSDLSRGMGQFEPPPNESRVIAVDLSEISPEILETPAMTLENIRRGQDDHSKTWVRSPLIHLLQQNEGSKATDPRDHVFALLGISFEAEEPALKPDYHESLNQIYVRVAKYFVEHSYGPQLLGSGTLNISDSDWPSWVPRWAESVDQVLFPNSWRGTKVFTAAGQTVPAFRIHAKSNILVVRGIIFDTIELLGSSRFVIASVEDVENAADEYEMTFACLAEILVMLGSPRSHQYGGSISETVSRLSICDRERDRDVKASERHQTGLKYFAAFAADKCSRRKVHSPESTFNLVGIAPLFREPTPLDSAETRVWAREFQMTAWLQFRRLIRCLTRKGYTGQVLPNAKVGDRIAIIHGCPVPYLLRPSGNGRYSLVSNCYIHGIMYGEFLGKETEVQDIEIV